jgi:putative tricarboxylic transport membrane protein
LKRQEQIGCIFFNLFSLLAIFGGYKLGLGKIENPGPGFFPFWAGIFLLIISFQLLIKTTIMQVKDDAKVWAHIKWNKIVVTLLSLIVYALVFNWLGFVLSTFLLMLVLFKLVDPQKLVLPLISSLLTVGVAYVVFKIWLKLYFPEGLLGF